MNFANAIYREGTHKLTENGAAAYNSAAQGDLLDLFAQIAIINTNKRKSNKSQGNYPNENRFLNEKRFRKLLFLLFSIADSEWW